MRFCLIVILCILVLSCKRSIIHIRKDNAKKQLIVTRKGKILDSISFYSKKYTRFKVSGEYLYYTDRNRIPQISRATIIIHKIRLDNVRERSKKDVLNFSLDLETLSNIKFTKKELCIITKTEKGSKKRMFPLVDF